jgi:hypothetical protein
MAYMGKVEYAPVWLPEDLPEEILAESYFQLLEVDKDGDDEESSQDRDSSCGFIVRDWFGPFLLSPPTRFLRGRC